MHFRAQSTFKFKFSDDHPNVLKETISSTSKDDGENQSDVVDTHISDTLTSKIAGGCEELSSQNDYKFYSSEKNRKGVKVQNSKNTLSNIKLFKFCYISRYFIKT